VFLTPVQIELCCRCRHACKVSIIFFLFSVKLKWLYLFLYCFSTSVLLSSIQQFWSCCLRTDEWALMLGGIPYRCEDIWKRTLHWQIDCTSHRAYTLSSKNEET